MKSVAGHVQAPQYKCVCLHTLILTYAHIHTLTHAHSHMHTQQCPDAKVGHHCEKQTELLLIYQQM